MTSGNCAGTGFGGAGAWAAAPAWASVACAGVLEQPDTARTAINGITRSTGTPSLTGRRSPPATSLRDSRRRWVHRAAPAPDSGLSQPCRYGRAACRAAPIAPAHIVSVVVVAVRGMTAQPVVAHRRHFRLLGPFAQARDCRGGDGTERGGAQPLERRRKGELWNVVGADGHAVGVPSMVLPAGEAADPQ